MLGSLRILLLGLLLAHDLLGAAIPNVLIEAARGERSVERGARIFCRYFHQLGAKGPGLFQRWSIPLAMIPQRAARFRYALARAFLPAPKDFDFVNLPYALSPLYYAVRPLRLALQKRPTGPLCHRPLYPARGQASGSSTTMTAPQPLSGTGPAWKIRL